MIDENGSIIVRAELRWFSEKLEEALSMHENENDEENTPWTLIPFKILINDIENKTQKIAESIFVFNVLAAMPGNNRHKQSLIEFYSKKITKECYEIALRSMMITDKLRSY